MTNNYFRTIIILSLTYSVLMGSGFYGFGVDYYGSYNKPNFVGSSFERGYLGWRISTLTLFNFHLGVYINSFLLAFSSGMMLNEFFKLKKIYSLFLFISLSIILIHTWPIFQATSNAMRQGLCMSFVYLSLCSFNHNKIKTSIFFIFLSLFMHISAFIFISIYIATLVFKKIKFKNDLVIIQTTSICLGILYYLLINIFNYSPEASRTIGYDFKYEFLFINIFFIIFLTFNLKNFKNNIFYLFLYFFSFVAPTFFTNNLYWQFERINMMIVLMMIMVLVIFEKKQSIFLWFFCSVVLLYLTNYTGMYASFK